MVSRSFASALALLASFSSLATAQVTTNCQPMERDCPPDPAFGIENHLFNFNATPDSAIWSPKNGKVTYTPDKGAVFTINKQGESPTIETNFYFFFGRTEVWLKAASGTGIISSIVWLSDCLDEVDWEFMGGNVTHAETNYFGKAQPDYLNAIYHPVDAGVQGDYHNYTTVWTKDQMDFYIDSNLVRTLLPKDANNTRNYPQTPMKLSLGIWAGGDPTLPKGTREWAGGDTDYSKAPFTMYVKSAQVSDFSSGKEYIYTDRTASWESIRIVAGNSTAKETIFAPPPQSIGDKWANLSPGVKTAIYASSAAVGALLVLVCLYYCIRRRRQGAREAKLAEERLQKDRMELERLKRDGIDPDSFIVEQSEYDAVGMRNDGYFGADGKRFSSLPGTPTGPPSQHSNKAWDAAAIGGAGVGAMALHNRNEPRSPMPLLSRDGTQSPGVPSPNVNGSMSPYAPVGAPPSRPVLRTDTGSGSLRAVSHGGNLNSPMRTQSPGMPPSFPPPASPGSRSFSTPTNMRNQGGNGGYGVMPRMNSPGPNNMPPPRSYTGGQGMGGMPQQGYGGDRGGYGEQGVHGGNAGGYWR